MGRHHDKKYGAAGLGGTSGRYGTAPLGRYGMRSGASIAGFIPLIGLGALAAILWTFYQKRGMGFGASFSSGCGTCVL
jgi:hypothetical protein